MDAKSRRRRESTLSPREQRWSMSSQTLERIVAELMKPLSHCRQSFDRDDSGLLEEYLTAAGLRALAAVEAGEPPREPNYQELALVIQSCSRNYGRKVDALSRLVIDFNHQLTEDMSATSEDTCEASGRDAPVAGRARAASQGAGEGLPFTCIALVGSAAARRETTAGTPPPTLPRGYAELRPQKTRPGRRLYEYDAVGDEHIGAVDDFLLARRLHNGFLMEELDSGEGAGAGGGGGAGARGMSLLELQAACAPPLAAAPLPPASPAASSPASPPPPTPPMPPPAALRRKRRSEVRIEDMMPGSLGLQIDDNIRGFLSRHVEFSVDERWIRRVVRHRRDAILCARRQPSPTILGWAGWEPSEARDAARASARLAACLAALYSPPRTPPCTPPRTPPRTPPPEQPAATNGPLQRHLNPAELARDVRSVLPGVAHCVSWQAIAAAAGSMRSTGLILYDLLKKACEGEVEIVGGSALSLGAFSVRVLTEARAVRADDEDWQLLTGVKRRSPPPPPRPRPRPLPRPGTPSSQPSSPES